MPRVYVQAGGRGAQLVPPRVLSGSGHSPLTSIPPHSYKTNPNRDIS